ncbi:hypothetical protein BJ742DRAFT_111106 [Cladochytrium replicatum]|nr:hypothetical protein BJ742DRAFT_111106 [Cladochytrium replicatum]
MPSHLRENGVQMLALYTSAHEPKRHRYQRAVSARSTCCKLYQLSLLMLLAVLSEASATLVGEHFYGAILKRQGPNDPPASPTATDGSPSPTVFPQSNATTTTSANSTDAVVLPTESSTASPSTSPSADFVAELLEILQQYWPWIVGFGAGILVIVVLVVVVFCNAPRRSKRRRPRSESHGEIILPDENNSIRDAPGQKRFEESRSKASSKWSGSAGLFVPADAALGLDDRESSTANRSRMLVEDDPYEEEIRGRSSNNGRPLANRVNSTTRNKKALLNPETLEEVFSNSPTPSFERRAGAAEPKFVPGSMVMNSQNFDDQHHLKKPMHKRSASEPYQPAGNQFTSPRSALYADLVTGSNTKRFSQLSDFSSAHNNSTGFRPDPLAPVGSRSGLDMPQLHQQQKISTLLSPPHGSQQMTSYSSQLTDSHYDVIPKRLDGTSPQYPPQQHYQNTTLYPSSLAQQPAPVLSASGFAPGQKWSHGGLSTQQISSDEGGASHQSEASYSKRISQQFASRQAEIRQNRISGNFDGYGGSYHSEQEGNVIYYHSSDRPQLHRFSDEFGYGQPESRQGYFHQRQPQMSEPYHIYYSPQQMPMGMREIQVGDSYSSRPIAAPMPVEASTQVAPTNLMTMIASPPPTDVHRRWVSGQTSPKDDGASLSSSGSDDQTVSDRRASSYTSAPRLSRVVDENFFRESIYMSDTLGRNPVTIVGSGDEADLSSPGRDSQRRSGGSIGAIESRHSMEGGKRRTSMAGSTVGSERGKWSSLDGPSSSGGTSIMAPPRGGIPLERPLSFVSSESPATTSTSTIQSVNVSLGASIPVGLSAVPASPNVTGPPSQLNSSRLSTTDSLSSYFDCFETDDDRSTTDLRGSRAGSRSSRGEPDYETEDESVFNAGDNFASSINKDFGFLGGSSASSNGSSASYFGRSAPGVVAPLPAMPWSTPLGVEHAPSPLAAALNLTALSPSPHFSQSRQRDFSTGSPESVAGPSRIDGSTSPARMSQAEARRIVDDAFSKNVNLRRGETIMTNTSSVGRSSPYDSDTNDGEILDSLGDRRTSDATTVTISGSGKRTSINVQQPRES